MSTEPIISIANLNKTYSSGLHALKDINLQINKGEIFALLGPNGAGKTTLISTICGIVNPTSGNISVTGLDIKDHYRQVRAMIGLVPQELTTDAFETVWNTVNFSRGLFGKPKNPAYIEEILKRLSLWEKKDNKIMTLSGGMKRRLMIAKALSHEPSVLFLDEPTAGVDVELRQNMWNQVHALRESGVTIILTTHYIEEAEEMSDRIGVINKGELILIEEKARLMTQLGKKELVLQLNTQLEKIPAGLKAYELKLNKEKDMLTFEYNTQKGENKVTQFLDHLKEAGITYKDLSTRQSSLEDIFIELVGQK